MAEPTFTRILRHPTQPEKEHFTGERQGEKEESSEPWVLKVVDGEEMIECVATFEIVFAFSHNKSKSNFHPFHQMQRRRNAMVLISTYMYAHISAYT